MDDSQPSPSVVEESDEEIAETLQEVIERFDCTSGTLHRMEDDGLHLVAHVNIPDVVLERIERIPVGKGMAGLAAERREPVDVCNLQTDDSGVAEDGARDTGMEGSLAAPILGPDDTLEGTIGIAKPTQYEFSREERDQLVEIGERIAHRL